LNAEPTYKQANKTLVIQHKTKQQHFNKYIARAH